MNEPGSPEVQKWFSSYGEILEYAEANQFPPYQMDFLLSLNNGIPEGPSIPEALTSLRKTQQALETSIQRRDNSDIDLYYLWRAKLSQVTDLIAVIEQGPGTPEQTASAEFEPSIQDTQQLREALTTLDEQLPLPQNAEDQAYLESSAGRVREAIKELRILNLPLPQAVDRLQTEIGNILTNLSSLDALSAKTPADEERITRLKKSLKAKEAALDFAENPALELAKYNPKEIEATLARNRAARP